MESIESIIKNAPPGATYYSDIVDGYFYEGADNFWYIYNPVIGWIVSAHGQNRPEDLIPLFLLKTETSDPAPEEYSPDNDLRVGDYVRLDGVDNIDHVVEAFLRAGAKPGLGFPYRENKENYQFLFWDTDGRLNRARKGYHFGLKRGRSPARVEKLGRDRVAPPSDKPEAQGRSIDIVIIDDLIDAQEPGTVFTDEEDVRPGDEVNQPSHYKRKPSDELRAVRSALLEDGEIDNLECIEAMLSHFSTVDQVRGYLRGNSFKYRWRYEDKDRTKSLRKARWYDGKLEQLEEIVEEHNDRIA